jgi:ABC-2 type transport system permease protein
VKAFVRRLLGLLRTSYAYMNEYRAELVLWALANSLSFILMGVWKEATERGSFALSSLDVVRYFLAVFVVRQLTVVWVIWEIEMQVVQGKLAPLLLQPVDIVWRHLMSHVAERFARLPFSAALVALFFVLYPKAFFVPSASTFALFSLLCLCAFLLRFAIQYTISLGCFWTERASSIEMVTFLFYMFLGGALAPLDFFPAPMREVIMYTPFPYLIWFPSRLLLGGVDGAAVLRAFVTMGAWFAACVVVNRLLWRAGLRRFSAMGA